MYSRYAENQGWNIQVVNTNEGEHGGYKEVIANVTGDGAYGIMKFESGGHRAQRVLKLNPKAEFTPPLVP